MTTKPRPPLNPGPKPTPEESEDYQSLYYLVKVKVYGKRRTLVRDVMVRISRAIHHHHVNTDFQIMEFDERWIPMLSSFRPNQRWYHYDAKGDDMGCHEGHDEPLLPVHVGDLPGVTDVNPNDVPAQRWDVI